MHKYDGQELRPLTATEVKQIAGRAGRFGGAHAAGYVTCLSESDLPLLRQSLATASEAITDACLLPRCGFHLFVCLVVGQCCIRACTSLSQLIASMRLLQQSLATASEAITEACLLPRCSFSVCLFGGWPVLYTCVHVFSSQLLACDCCSRVCDG
jgi:replicative superfamily II helicase